MHILGVSCHYHDAAAALLRDGVLVAAAEEERFSRRKHDARFPTAAIAFCLQTAGIRAEELDYVVFYEKPLVKFGRILTSTLGGFPRAWRVFREAMTAWFAEKLWIKGQLVTHLRIAPERVLFVEHHLAHAASAFLCAPYPEAALLTVDGVGEWTTTALGYGRTDAQGRTTLTLDQELRFPHSLGLLYSAFTAYLGFEVNEGEYKVMGMAPYGEPRYLDALDALVQVAPDGAFRLNMDYFSFTHSTEQSYNARFAARFGPPRPRETPFYTARTHPAHDFPDWDTRVAAENQRYADIAASIQRRTEEIVLALAHEAHRRTHARYLCLAGGVALNSVANGRLAQETPFEEIFIQPAAGDSGGALGAALYAHVVLLGQPRTFTLEHAYWGQAYTPAEIETCLRDAGARYTRIEDDTRLLTHVTEALLAQQVVGWFQGRFEWGPRALGHRSILADPRAVAMKARVNEKIKFREPFRPFAPVVPEESVGDFFEMRPAARNYPARYMLVVHRFKDGQGERLGAVNHGGTGRVQAVRASDDARYYGLVQLFGQATGLPVLLNTSFNLRGEPIVASPAEALATFARSGLDLLVLGDALVRKEDLK